MKNLQLNLELIELSNSINLSPSMEDSFWKYYESDFTAQHINSDVYLTLLKNNGFLDTTDYITWEQSLYLHENKTEIRTIIRDKVSKIIVGNSFDEFITKMNMFMGYYEYDSFFDQYNFFSTYKYPFNDNLDKIVFDFKINEYKIINFTSTTIFEVNFYCSIQFQMHRYDFIILYTSPRLIAKKYDKSYIKTCLLSNALLIEKAQEVIISSINSIKANSWSELLLKTSAFTSTLVNEDLLCTPIAEGDNFCFQII